MRDLLVPTLLMRGRVPIASVLGLLIAYCLAPSSARSEEPFKEQVLFAFDDYALPLQNGVRLKLNSYRSPGEEGDSRVAVPVGPPGSPDGRGVIYYGTVLEVNGELWMWYLGMGDRDEGRHYRICFAKSKDGKTWQKPELGLVDYGGNRRNNLVDLDQGKSSIAGCVVFYDPQDGDPNRRFKMLFTGTKYPGLLFAVAYSPDGVRWKESADNPRGAVKFEPQGGIQWNGAFYVNGQGGRHWAPDGWIRTLNTHISYDFEHWTESTVLGFRRDPLPPRPVGHTGGVDGEQVHLGAGLWNRGNVVVGFYGQWHGHPTNDRRWVSMDIGLVVSHDALHFREPIPDFRMIQAAENTSSWLPSGRATSLERAPALMQGQGFANVGDETLFWYSVWVVPTAGLRVARWDRDRLGYLQPFISNHSPHVVSAPIATGGKPVAIELNVSGLNRYSGVKVSVLDEQFREIPGYSAGDCTAPEQSGLAQRAIWGKRRQAIARGPIRVRVDFTGVRPEDARLFAIYVKPD